MEYNYIALQDSQERKSINRLTKFSIVCKAKDIKYSIILNYAELPDLIK